MSSPKVRGFDFTPRGHAFKSWSVSFLDERVSVIFKSPIFWPNPPNSTSILGDFCIFAKNRPKIEVILRELGKKIGLPKMMSKCPLF